jgi:Tol biopolymer transport system component/predicted Ser/Thr protein kinase
MKSSAKDLYGAAVGLAPGARKQYLDEHCTDPAVRSEVEALLAADPTKTIAVATALAPGSTIGHYTVTRSLGAGGMGLVYEAVDQKLHRTVAIKVLLPGRIDDDSRIRFLREAQVASSLNHPNIATVYEVGRDRDMDFIVMECIPGSTLRALIGEKKLPLRTSLSYAIQIADAVSAAHEAGIVHRDLKPGNVMVTERGLAKVLDFGLAKVNKSAGEETSEMSLTKPGQAVGTVFYMSPEQAQGKNVDSRSDLFSFGSVLYEMFSGERAFQGDTEIGTLAAVLERQPRPISALTPDLPVGLQRLIAKCLEKKPQDRWQHMADVRLMLQDLLKDLDSPPPGPVAAPPKSKTPWLFVAAGLAAGAVIALAAIRFIGTTKTAAAEPIYRMVTATNGLNDYPALSRDAGFIAFSSDRGGDNNLDIWLQQIGAPEPIRLTKDPADETDPAFSPDGTHIAFRSEKNGGGIYVVPALGGDPMLIAPGGRNPRFSPDGHWLAYWTGRREGSATAGSAQVFIVEATGGQPRAIHPEMRVALYPTWSPRGDRLLVRGWKDSISKGAYDFWSLPLDGGAPVKSGGYPRFIAQGLFGVSATELSEQWPLDWTTPGQAIFANKLGDSSNIWQADVTPEGVFTSDARRITSGPGRQSHPTWAATTAMERLAVSDQVVNYDIWTLPVDPAKGTSQGERTRLTSSIAVEWAPSLSADGRQLLYLTSSSGDWNLVLKDLDSGHTRTLVSSPTLLGSAAISGDGRRVAYTNKHYDLLTTTASGGTLDKVCDYCGTINGISKDGSLILYEPVKDEDLMAFDTHQRKTLTLALRQGPDVILSGGRFSPDEKWVSFHSIEGPGKTTRVWIAPVHLNAPAPQSEWIGITEGADFAEGASWSTNGKVLYYMSERDGSECFWGQTLDPKTLHPTGDPFVLQHFHSSRQSLRGLESSGYLIGLSTGGARAVFSFGELTGNIWLQETARGK